jgi:hypothetical protein
MTQDVKLYCVACETLMTQTGRKNVPPNKVEFDLICDPAKGGCGRQHKLTRVFNGTAKTTDIFLLTKTGREDRLRA